MKELLPDRYILHIQARVDGADGEVNQRFAFVIR